MNINELVQYIQKKWEWRSNADFDPYFEAYVLFIDKNVKNKSYNRRLTSRWLDSLKRKDNCNIQMQKEHENISAEQSNFSFVDIDTALKPLTERQKKISHLLVEGYQQSEITGILDINISTIKRDLVKIREFLTLQINLV